MRHTIAPRIGMIIIVIASWSFALWRDARPIEGGPSYFEVLSQVPPLTKTTSDQALYMHIVRRIHDGEGYYSASTNVLYQKEALDQGGRDFSTPFSHRLPTLYWLLGALPPTGIPYVIALLLAGTLATVSGYALASRFASTPLALVSCALIAWFYTNVASSVVIFAPEVWAAAFGVLSLALFVHVDTEDGGRIPATMWAAAGAAVAAMLFREIAVAFVLVGLVASLADARSRSARHHLPWLVAIGLSAAAYLAHMIAVSPWLTQTPAVVTMPWFDPDGSGVTGSVVRLAALLAVPWPISVALIALGIAGSLIAPMERPHRVVLAATTIGGIAIMAAFHPPGYGVAGTPPAYWYDLVAPATLACTSLALTFWPRLRAMRA